MKTKIKKSSIISLVIAFSMVFTAFTPIVSYADEVTSNDTILNGEEQSNGQTSDVEKPSDGQVPDGEKPSDSQVPDGRNHQTVSTRWGETIRWSDPDGRNIR
ncbi:putative surface domain protein [Clostridioides difficile DA00306]|uniref:hypothetical protein n=1 Tax=Clostridioides difficile TaxID=1496 RepID=UPI00038D2EA5|nr:hypothetical protein [Clostridioides difficile]EQH69184.1 putative surface domain protein [Clostridioides difficile DA00306]